jgi:hypothetical protein
MRPVLDVPFDGFSEIAQLMAEGISSGKIFASDSIR